MLQCETTGVIVRTPAHLNMKMCDLYGSKVSIGEIFDTDGTYELADTYSTVCKTICKCVLPSSNASLNLENMYTYFQTNI